jgi:dolichol-phosphate mannosyltransferase
MTLSPETVTRIRAFRPMLLINPVFNHQSKISHSLEKIKQAIESAFNNYELIVVNDGSTDNTLAILRDVALTDERMHILSYTPNRGKGYAVRQGILHSHGDVVMFLDGDLDISPDSIRDYVAMLSTSDLVIASKRHPKSSVKIPRSRAFLSRAFNLFMRVATGIPQKDTQAGFKAGNGVMMRTIFKNASINRYAFDVELFTIASILHLRVQEMPVIMKIERKFNTKGIVNMFADVIRISYRYRVLHAYGKELSVNLPVAVDYNRSQYQQDGLEAQRSVIISPACLNLA